MSEQKFTFHCIGLPHTKTNDNYVGCAYTQKVLKFCKMMTTRGHTVYHYGTEGSDPICTENINVLSDVIYKKVYGDHDFKTHWFKYDTNDEAYRTFYRNTINEINKRKKKGDFVLAFWGGGVKPICDAEQDLICVEPGIGYGWTWCKYRAFESGTHRHAIYGPEAASCCMPKPFDRVVPNYFDIDDFTFNDSYKDRMANGYFLFTGRIYDGKGLNIAIAVSKILGKQLLVCGQLDDSYRNYPFDDQVKYIGYVDKYQRDYYMRHAIASFVASQYLEPFGGVQIENLLCGTPTITSDWGAFVENNIQGVTGYRCNTLDDYINAAMDCCEGKIDYYNCRKKGLEFSLENIAPIYEKWFADISFIEATNNWWMFTNKTAERVKKFKYEV